MQEFKTILCIYSTLASDLTDLI